MPQQERSTSARANLHQDVREQGASKAKFDSDRSQQEEAIHAQEPQLGGDFTRKTFDKHVALLSDSRLSQPANAGIKDQILRKLQSDYGNQYVQRVINHITAKRGETAQANREPGPSEEIYRQSIQRIVNYTFGPSTSDRSLEAPPQVANRVVRMTDSKLSILQGNAVQRETIDGAVMRRKGAYLHEEPGKGSTIGDRLPNGTPLEVDLDDLGNTEKYVRVTVTGGKRHDETGYMNRAHIYGLDEGLGTPGGGYSKLVDPTDVALGSTGNVEQAATGIEEAATATVGGAVQGRAKGIGKGIGFATLDAVTAPIGVPVGTIAGGIDGIIEIMKQAKRGKGGKELAKQAVFQTGGAAGHWSVGLIRDATGLCQVLYRGATGKFDENQAIKINKGIQLLRADIVNLRTAAERAEGEGDIDGSAQLLERADEIRERLNEILEAIDERHGERVALI